MMNTEPGPNTKTPTAEAADAQKETADDTNKDADSDATQEDSKPEGETAAPTSETPTPMEEKTTDGETPAPVGETPAPAEEKDAGPATPPNEAIYQLNESKEQTKGEWDADIVKKTAPDDAVVAAPENQEVADVTNLKEISKPVSDDLFYPVITDESVKEGLGENELQGVNGIGILKYGDTISEMGEGGISFSINQIVIKMPDVDIQIQTSKIMQTCEILGSPAVCCMADMAGDATFKPLAENAGFKMTETDVLILESHEGNQIFKFKKVEEAQMSKALILQLTIKNSSKFAIYQTENKGAVHIDDNSGNVIFQNEMPDGELKTTYVGINSIEGVTQSLSKNEVTIEYLHSDDPDPSAKPTKKKVTFEFPQNPKNIEPESDDPKWYSFSFQKQLESAMNVYQQQQIQQKKDKQLTVLQDIDANFNSKEPIIMQSFKYPLKMMKMIENQTSDSVTCLTKNYQLIYIAQMYSASNPFMLLELLQFYYIKKAFPSTNANFEGVVFQNWIKFFKIEDQAKDFEPISFRDHDITKAIAHRFLQQINEEVCKVGKSVTIEEQKEMLQQDAQRFSWKTDPQFEKYRDEVSSFVPHVNKKEAGEECKSIKTRYLMSYIINKGILDAGGISWLIDTTEQRPETSFLLTSLFAEMKMDFGDQQLKFSEGLIDAVPSLKLKEEDPFGDFAAKLNENDISKQFTIQGQNKKTDFQAEIGPAVILLKKNILGVLQGMDEALLATIEKKLLKNCEKKNIAYIVLVFAANKKKIELKFKDTPILAAVNDMNKVKSVLNEEKCDPQLAEGIEGFCVQLDGLKKGECSEGDLKIMNEVAAKAESDAPADSGPNKEEAPSTPGKSQCDPDMAEALGKLDIENLQIATENAINFDDCTAAKKFTSQLINFKNGVTPEQVDSLVNSQSNSPAFTQLASHNSTKHKNKAKITLKKTEMQNPGLNALLDGEKCQGTEQKAVLIPIMKLLDQTLLKDVICASLQDEFFRKAFENTNEELSDTMKGTSENPHFDQIPDIPTIENDIDSFQKLLHCNHICLKAFIGKAASGGMLSFEKVISSVTTKLGEMPDDIKSHLDKELEIILPSEDNASVKFSKAMELTELPGVFLEAIMNAILGSNVSDVSPHIQSMMKESELCTKIQDDMTKFKSVAKAKCKDDKLKSILNTTLQDKNNDVGKRYIYVSNKCEAIAKEKQNDISELLMGISDLPADAKAVLGQKEVDGSLKMEILFASNDQAINVSDEVKALIKAEIEKLDGVKAKCMFNELASCQSFLDVTKEVNIELLGEINDIKEESEEDLALLTKIAETLPVSEKRTVIEKCTMSNPELPQHTIIAEQKCISNADQNNSALFDMVISVQDKIDQDEKKQIEDITAGPETFTQKVMSLMSMGCGLIIKQAKHVQDTAVKFISTPTLVTDEMAQCVFEESVANPHLRGCLMVQLKSKMKCIAKPEECQFIIANDGEKVLLDTGCTPVVLEKLTEMIKEKDVSVCKADPKLTVDKEGSCLQDGTAAGSQLNIAAKSPLKTQVFSFAMKIEDADMAQLKKEAEEVQQAETSLKVCEESEKDEGGNCADGDLNALMDKLTGEMNEKLKFIAADVIKEQIEAAKAVLNQKLGIAEDAPAPAADAGKEAGAAGGEEGAAGAGSEGQKEGEPAKKDEAKPKPGELVQSNPEDPGESEVNNPANKADPELWNLLQVPDNMKRSTGVEDETKKNLFRAKQAMDIASAFQFDEQLAAAKAKQKVKPADVDALKLKIANIIKMLDAEETKISPGDNTETIIAKLNKLDTDLSEFTVKDDFNGPEDASYDITSDKLKYLKTTYKMDDIIEVTEPDLKTMVFVAAQQNDIIMQKPVFAMNVYNKMRNADYDGSKLPKTMVDGEDAAFAIDDQLKKGLAHLCLLNKFKGDVSAALAEVIPKIEGDVKEELAKVMDEFVKASKTVSVLPGIQAGLLFQADKEGPKQPPIPELKEGFELFKKLKNSAVPDGDFWMMKKIMKADTKNLDKQPSMVFTLQAALTVERLKLSGICFRSIDIVKNIQKSFKSASLDRNFLKDLTAINMMSKGDVFVDYLAFRQLRRDENQKKKIEEAKEEAKKASGGGEASGAEKTEDDGKDKEEKKSDGKKDEDKEE